MPKPAIDTRPFAYMQGHLGYRDDAAGAIPVHQGAPGDGLRLVEVPARTHRAGLLDRRVVLH